MNSTDNTSFEYEVNRLFLTVNYLNNYKEQILSRKTMVDSVVDYGVSHYNSDNAEQFSELTIYSTIQGNINTKLKQIGLSIDKPYFARFDFTEKDSDQCQMCYLGKMSLYDESKDEFVIVDWRAPIASLYYEQRLGSAAYECVDGIISGELSLKRQYFIENGQLKNIMDIDITTNDTFLQAALGSNKDNRLKDIVTTIQAEQNKVIRADMWTPLIVQGAAGGGKTTIALHRIAYLMYNNEKTLKANNFMIIAPNRFFLSYISEVLPELGVENVQQTTYEDLVFEIIGHKYKLVAPHEKLSKIINFHYNDAKDSASKLQKLSMFKSSLIYANMVMRYLKELEINFLPEEDFKIGNYVLLSHKELQRRFMMDFGKKPFYRRVLELKKSLINTLSQEKEKIILNIENTYEIELNKVRRAMEDCPQRRNTIIAIIDERDNAIKKAKNKIKTLVKDYFSKVQHKTCFEYYLDFQNNLQKYNKEDIKEDILNQVRESTFQLLEKHKVEFEDLAPLVYMYINIYGLKEDLDIRHIIIDEAQDFSLFQILSLKSIMNSGSFTILGDLCQGIYSYAGIRNWDSVIKKLFRNCNCNFLTLEQSYRTTVEIMDMANVVMDKLSMISDNYNFPKAKPVIRHGSEVSIACKKDLKDICQCIDEEIASLDSQGFKSLAIICKNLDECKESKKYLKSHVAIISGKEEEYEGGIVLIPSYLAKGLEFDMVVILNASENVYKPIELDIKLLYVAMTRPLHRLQIYYLGNVTTLLQH